MTKLKKDKPISVRINSEIFEKLSKQGGWTAQKLMDFAVESLTSTESETKIKVLKKSK